MRLSSVRIENYGGIRRAQLGGLDDAPVVTLSGRNGSGKSLLLAAIATVWAQNWAAWDQRIGPWGTTATVEVGVRFRPDEWRRIRAFLLATGQNAPEDEVPDQCVLTVKIDRNGGPQPQPDGLWWSAFQHAQFRRQHPFGNIDLLPADRSIPRNERPTINPAILGVETAEQLRGQIVTSVANRQLVQLTGVTEFLTTLDYVQLVANRRGGQEGSGDFALIADAFYEATSKRIFPPEIREGVPTVEVETPSGARHPVDDLSSGEQEVLGLMYFARRLSASGGVVLIDEPELHLHPALQRALFRVFETVAERAQIVIATHAPGLVTAARLGAVLHMKPAAAIDDNQLVVATAEPARTAIIDDLGLHPVDLLQSDYIMVVEGQSDYQRLSAFLPIELSRAAVHIAGDQDRVTHAARTLAESGQPVPFVAVRDRDTLSDDELSDLIASAPNLWVWPSRSIENEILSPPMIVAALERTGRQATIVGVESALRELAEADFEWIVADVVRKQLASRHGFPRPEHAGPIDLARRNIDAAVDAASARARDFDIVLAEVEAGLRARWADDWRVLMNGKRVLGRFVDSQTPFSSTSDFISALSVVCREDESLLPTSFRGLRLSIETAIARSTSS